VDHRLQGLDHSEGQQGADLADAAHNDYWASVGATAFSCLSTFGIISNMNSMNFGPQTMSTVKEPTAPSRSSVSSFAVASAW
jgi:hypothetical protein